MREWINTTLAGVKDGITSRHWPDRPHSINLEITSICDSKCIHCPRHEMDRPMKAMDFELFKKLVDQAAALGVPEICPNGFGEVMTIKNLDPYFDYLSSREHKFRIVINTNGFRMSEEKIELLIKSKVYLLNICLDGATAATAEAVRVNLKLDQIESNIARLMQIRKERNLDYPRVRVGMVVIPQNRHEVEAFIEKWKGKVDFLGIDGYSNRAGSLTEKFGGPEPAAEAPPATCVLPFKELNIWSDGKAVICCNDWNQELVIGDLTKQSLQEIWHGEGARRVRELHREKRGNDLEICKKCNYWKTPSFGARLWTVK
ncbi:MAG TPA: radical SAM/SPASM domain-containing protein [Bdellovibrionota bacterium]|jgi:radical SAM protein with 4Fe4S-binding SPASM domain